MSFFDDASLAFLPSGGAGKDGKAYSIKPTDGSGDFTFSRGSNLAATRVGPTGLIEKGRENLLTYSNEFDTTWFNGSSSETNGQPDKDGGTDAWLVTKSAANGYIGQNITQSGVTTFSVYAKANDSDYMQFLCDGGAYQFFNLSNGSLAAGNAIDAEIEAIGTDGWYRCSMVQNASITRARIYPAENNTTSASSGSIYIQDSQLEIGLAATEVIESGATTGKAGLLEDEPRFDYSGGATCPSLLLEGSRTNLVSQSEYFGDNSNSNCTIDINDATSPDGLTTASKVIGSGTDIFIRTRQSVAVPSAGDYIFSLFAKKGNVTKVEIRALTYSGSTGLTEAKFDLEAGTALTAGAFIEDYGNGWYKCSTPVTIDAGDLSGSLSIYAIGSNGSIIYSSNADTNGEYFYTWGWEVEQGSYPTSYIPTYGVSQTRLADVCKAESVGSLIGQTEGTFYYEFIKGDDFGVFAVSNNGNSSRFLNYPSGSNYTFFAQSNSGSVLIVANYAKSNFLEGVNKLAIKYASGVYKAFLNGVEVVSSSIATNDLTLNKVNVNSANNDIITAKSPFNKVLIFEIALSDEACIELTTIS